MQHHQMKIHALKTYRQLGHEQAKLTQASNLVYPR